MTYLILLFSFLLIYYIFFLNEIHRGLNKVAEKSDLGNNNEFISVIIPFRNERKNILQSLNSLSNQSLLKGRFEVIYIDDNSDDGSFEILKEADKPENFILLKSPFSIEERGHKKQALKYAIEKANGEIIVTTDADCYHNKNWLKILTNYFDKETAFVSGPVEFESDGSLFQNLQKLEFSSLILVGAGLIGIGKPIICNAANLGFRKSVFNEVGGYEDNLNLSSGDDEFLMQKIAKETNYKVKFCFNKGAKSFTKANISISDFYQQRKRWASKGFHYKDYGIVLKLTVIFLFYLSLPVQFSLGLFFNQLFLLTFVLSLTLKYVIEYRIVNFDRNSLFAKTSLKLFLLAELVHIPYILISGITGIFGNYKWKGRKVKR
jgi:cellulose synthase/poly-beta-1,6-N-acetylglucosamine synthase-like glycosyltransferase